MTMSEKLIQKSRTLFYHKSMEKLTTVPNSMNKKSIVFAQNYVLISQYYLHI